jgi:TolA-binding protein
MSRPTLPRLAISTLLAAAVGCGGAGPARVELPVPLPIALVRHPPHPPRKLPPVPGHEAPMARRPLEHLGQRAAEAPAPPLPAEADPVVDDRAVAAARAVAARARGAQRLAAKGALAHLLAVRARATPASEPARAAALAAFTELTSVPGYGLTPSATPAPPTALPIDLWLRDHARLLIAADQLDGAHRAAIRLFKDHPTSAHAPLAYFELAEAAAARGEVSLAVDAYDHVVAYPDAPMLTYARYKLGRAQLDAGNPGAAISSWTAVAAGTDPALRKAALDELADAYAQAGKADTAWAMFHGLDPDHAVDRLELLADRYLDFDKDIEAATVLKAVLEAQPDPARACADRVWAIRAEAARAHRDVIVEDARALAEHLVGDACVGAADALLGELAWAWHDEQRATQAHPEPIVALWEVVSQLSLDPRRRANARANRADLLWRLAGQRWVVEVWLAAAEASTIAAAAAPTDRDLADDAVDAWDNAGRVARRDAGATARVPPALLARIRAGLAAAATGPAAARAHAAAAQLR